MNLINDIETVLANGVKVLFINNDPSLADMQHAEDMFIIPIIGQELYDILISELDVENSDYAELISKTQRALAPLAYWLDLPNIQTQITEKGTATFESKNMVAAHRWEYNAVRESLADKGCFALEKLLEFLFVPANKEYYNWTVPDQYNYTFKTAIDFNSYYPLYQPYRTFESLRPLIRQVEDQYIKPTIGNDFFIYLRDNEEPSAKEKFAIIMLKSAVANLAVQRACEVLPVKISSNGFTVALRDNTDGVNPQDQQAQNVQMGMLYKSVTKSGESYLQQLQQYLNDNASADTFPTFFNSVYYTSPAVIAARPDPNASRSGVFGLY